MKEIKERLFKSQGRNSGQNTFKNQKSKKTFQHIDRGDSIQTHVCIDANQKFTRCENHPNILPLFGGLEGSLTFSPFLSYTMKHTHISQKATIARGW
jgi:hypothetical protein